MENDYNLGLYFSLVLVNIGGYILLSSASTGVLTSCGNTYFLCHWLTQNLLEVPLRSWQKYTYIGINSVCEVYP